jgi:hypothetical protein
MAVVKVMEVWLLVLDAEGVVVRCRRRPKRRARRGLRSRPELTKTPAQPSIPLCLFSWRLLLLLHLAQSVLKFLQLRQW